MRRITPGKIRKRRLTFEEEPTDSTNQDVRTKSVTEKCESTSSTSGERDKKMRKTSHPSNNSRSPDAALNDELDRRYQLNRLIEKNSMYSKKMAMIVDAMCKQLKMQVFKYLVHLDRQSNPKMFIPAADKLKPPLNLVNAAIKEIRGISDESESKLVKSVMNLATLMRALTIDGPTRISGDRVLKNINKTVLLHYYETYRVNRLETWKTLDKATEQLYVKCEVFRIYTKEALEWCDRIGSHYEIPENLKRKRPAGDCATSSESVICSREKVQKMDLGCINEPKIKMVVKTSSELSSCKPQFPNSSKRNEFASNQENMESQKLQGDVSKCLDTLKVHSLDRLAPVTNTARINTKSIGNIITVSKCDSTSLYDTENTQNRNQEFKTQDDKNEGQSRDDRNPPGVRIECGPSRPKSEFHQPGSIWESNTNISQIECNPQEPVIEYKPQKPKMECDSQNPGMEWGLRDSEIESVVCEPEMVLHPYEAKMECGPVEHKLEWMFGESKKDDSNFGGQKMECDSSEYNGATARLGSNGGSTRPGNHGGSTRPGNHGGSTRPGSHGGLTRPDSHGSSALPDSNGGTRKSDSKDNSSELTIPNTEFENYDPKEGCSFHYSDDLTDIFWTLSPEALKRTETKSKALETEYKCLSNKSNIGFQEVTSKSLDKPYVNVSNASNQLEESRTDACKKCTKQCKCKIGFSERRLELEELNDMFVETASEIENFFLTLDRTFNEIKALHLEYTDAQRFPLIFLKEFLKNPIDNLFKSK